MLQSAESFANQVLESHRAQGTNSDHGHFAIVPPRTIEKRSSCLRELGHRVNDLNS